MSTTMTLRIPALPGGRESARELVASLNQGHSFATVRLDASEVQAAAPSFIDELCKELLVNRTYARIDIIGASEHFLFVFDRSARARNVHARWSSLTASLA